MRPINRNVARPERSGPPWSSAFRARAECSVTRSPRGRRLRHPVGKLSSRGYSQPSRPPITWATAPRKTTRRRPARNRPRPAALTRRKKPKSPPRLRIPPRKSKVSSVGPRPRARRRTGLLTTAPTFADTPSKPLRSAGPPPPLHGRADPDRLPTARQTIPPGPQRRFGGFH